MKLSDEWIAGFFSGEGYVNSQMVGKYKAFSVCISQHERNVSLMDSIRASLNMGCVTKRKTNACHWRVHKQKDVERFCLTFIPLVHGHTKKKLEGLYRDLITYQENLLTKNL